MSRSQALKTHAAVGVPSPQGCVPVARPLMPTLPAIAPYLETLDANRWYTNFGPLVQALESRLTERFSRPTSVVTTTNGTQALTLALQALGAQPGGLCAMPSWTFAATAHAVLAAGLVPWFLDVDPVSGVLDTDHLARRLASSPGPVAAVLPVALFGQPFEYAPWIALQAKTGVPVLVDAAASFDTLKAAPLPTMVSLHATKLVSTGEGGLLASEDAALIHRVRKMTNFGFWGSREAQVSGGNAKLSEYAAAVGLASLDQWPSRRAALASRAQRLRAALVNAPWIQFQPGWGLKWISSTCCVRVVDRDAADLERRLADQGVATRRWWGDGCHAQAAFTSCQADPLPATEALARTTLGLPFFADMTHDEINRVSRAILDLS